MLLLSGNPTLKRTAPGISLDPTTGIDSGFEGFRTVYGLGVSPVGFEAGLHVGRGVRVYATTAAGFVYFVKPVPLPDARRFNYTFEGGGGVEFQMRSEWWLRMGYKFHHLSNGNSASDNPGVDANVLMVGVARQFGKR
jgi:opacity protein-like surface antigen